MEKRPGHGRRFQGDSKRLRAAERVAILQPERVAALSMKGAIIKTVLDVGTGTGLFAEAFSKMGARVFGVDVSADSLAAARKHLPAAVFAEGAAEKLPFDDASFDLVFLGHVLHETDDPLRALEEARRVARVNVAVMEWPYRAEEFGPPLEHRLRPADIETMARKAGLPMTGKIELPHAELYTFAAGREL